MQPTGPKTRSIKLSVNRVVKISLTLVPGTEEYRAYVRIKRKYLTEMNERQKNTSDDEMLKTDLGNCELVRGSLFALDQVPQEELPNYIDAGWKPKGRKALNTVTEDDNETDSDRDLDERATLLH